MKINPEDREMLRALFSAIALHALITRDHALPAKMAIRLSDQLLDELEKDD
jgi:hypothetical protein